MYHKDINLQFIFVNSKGTTQELKVRAYGFCFKTGNIGLRKSWSFYFLVISTGCVIMKLSPVARNRPLSTAVWAENLENLFSFWPFFDDAVRLDFLTNRWSYKKAKWLSMLFITFNSVLRFSAGKDHFFTRSRRQTWEIVWTNHKPPQLPLYAGK